MSVARGFKRIGRLGSGVAEAEYDDSDLIFFAPNADGTGMRSGFWRGRTFREERASYRAMVLHGFCVDDYVFVATAIGENAFK